MIIFHSACGNVSQILLKRLDDFRLNHPTDLNTTFVYIIVYNILQTLTIGKPDIIVEIEMITTK